MIRPRLFSASLLAIAAAVWAVPSRAAESGQMPQLNTALYPEQLFWLVVSFAILYALMAFVALPPVRGTQDNRAASIASELAAAQAANDEAKATLVKYEKALADARAEAQATVNEIAAQAAKESAARQAEQHRQLAERLAAAEARITAARDAAIKEVQNAAADLAGAIVQKVTATKRGSAHVV